MLRKRKKAGHVWDARVLVPAINVIVRKNNIEVDLSTHLKYCVGMEFYYNTIIGRILLNIMLNTGVLRLAEKYVKSKKSRWMIDRFIRKNNIDMSQYKDVEYDSYAAFFIREKQHLSFTEEKDAFISPCDSLLSMVEIKDGNTFSVKGIDYTLAELIPDEKLMGKYKDGLCLIFRLQASDYHHFCYVDDGVESGATLIPGKLHSVQPIALQKEPVFRVNKRYYHEIDTVHFGKLLQIEVGAVLVGGVHYEVQKGQVKKGQEAGRFELCGSTIMVLLTKETKNQITWNKKILEAVSEDIEVQVEYGQEIGRRTKI